MSFVLSCLFEEGVQYQRQQRKNERSIWVSLAICLLPSASPRNDITSGSLSWADQLHSSLRSQCCLIASWSMPNEISIAKKRGKECRPHGLWSALPTASSTFLLSTVLVPLRLHTFWSTRALRSSFLYISLQSAGEDTTISSRPR